MKFQLRPFQDAIAEDALAFFRTAKPGDRRLYASPTGTGKSVVELAIIERLKADGRTPWLVTPRVEIIAGMLDKMSVDVREMGEAALVEAAWERGITTPIRLRNCMLDGRGPNVDSLVIDEAHHDLAETYSQLHLLTGRCPVVGLTATPYRGTPKGTAAFREIWGEPVWGITLPEAVQEGYVAFPECHIVPLVDDDKFDVSSGDFTVASVTKGTASRLHEIAAFLRGWVGADGGIHRPSMVSLPGTELAGTLRELCQGEGIPTVVVTGTTNAADRKTAFDACVSGDAILIQINVVSEGVDLPIRRLLDCSPTLSPVRWLQQVGRITRPTRPGEPAPSYVCTNRNLLRHAYLMEGMIPRCVLADAQAAFPKTSARAAAGRVIGLEAVGRLKPASVPLASGLDCYLYAMSAVTGGRVTQYAVIVHPERVDPVWASRTNERGPDGITATYGRWRPCDPPSDLTGFASLAPSQVTEKQLQWWQRSARSRGLDPTIEPDRKQFAILPVLSDLRIDLR